MTKEEYRALLNKKYAQVRADYMARQKRNEMLTLEQLEGIREDIIRLGGTPPPELFNAIDVLIHPLEKP